MTDFTASRVGDINQGGTPLELFLKKFSGEVMSIYNNKTVMDGKHLTRNLTSGKSSQFPAIGGISAEYHTPGNQLTGLNVNHAERIISIDGLLVSHAFLANIDEAMNHYEVRQPYAKQMATTLANKYDLYLLKELIKGARASAVVNDGDGGTIITDSNLGSSTESTKVDAIISAIFDAATALDEKNAPEERFLALKPAEYNLLVQKAQSNGFSAIHKDYGGEGSIASGTIMELAGINILKSNQVPQTDTSGSDTYHGVDASTTVGTVWCPEATGAVKLMDLSSEAQYDITRQGHFMVSKMACGFGWLRPECCVELRTADPAV